MMAILMHKYCNNFMRYLCFVPNFWYLYAYSINMIALKIYNFRNHTIPFQSIIILFCSISYHHITYGTTLYHTTSLTHYTMPYHIHHTIPHYNIPHRTIPHTITHHTTLYHTIHTTSYHSTPFSQAVEVEIPTVWYWNLGQFHFLPRCLVSGKHVFGWCIRWALQQRFLASQDLVAAKGRSSNFTFATNGGHIEYKCAGGLW
jgi:hypothetical protein